MSTSDRVAKPGARPRPTEQRYSLPPHFDTLDRYNQTMPLPPPPLPVREGDAGVPPPPESPLPSPPESPRVIRLFEPSTPRERAQYTLLLGEDDVANDDDDGDDNNASGSKDVGESSDSEDESERRARDFASHKHGTLRSAVRKFSSAALVVMPINDAAMDDAISQSEAPQLSKPGAPRGMAPQPPAELVLERNKRAAKLAHVLSVSPSASSPVMRRRSARNKGPSFPAGELGDAELIVAARNEKLRRIFGDSFPAVQTAAVNAGATTAGAAATSSGGATSPKAAADTTPPLTPVTAPSIAPIDGAKLVEALPALMAQLAAPICGKARGFWREAGASVAAARIGGGVEGATTLADLLMAVADEIEELPLVYEYGVDFYSKMFADREHIAFVGQVESANADKSVPASTEPILVCVNTTPVPTDEAEQWYQTIGCGRWGLPLHAAGHAASLNTVRADGSSVLQPPPQPSAGGDDSLAASTRESVRIESRHSVLLAQTQSDVVKEVVAHAAQSRNPFATDTAAVAAAAAVVVDSVPSLTLAPPPASPPLSSSPSSTLNKSELNWRLSGDVPSLSPVSPKRNTSVALASSPSSGGSGEQADYRILVWYRTGNKELLIRAPAPRGRHRSTPPAKDFQRCVVQALDALWNGREQAEVRELDEARDEEFVVPLLDGLKRLGLAQALRDEQVSAHLERALKMSHAHENLIFWRAVERYRLLAEAQRRVYASTIVREFVCAGARFEVNLPDTMRNALLVEFSVACCEPIETLIDGAALQLLTASGKLEAMQTATTSSSTLTTKAMPVAMFDAAQEEVFGLLDGIVSSLLVTSGGSEALVARVREDRERRRRELLARRVSFNLELASDVPELSVQLRNYEASDPQKPYCFSIGLMYVAAGQTTEAQWFGNQQGSPAFARFLSFMAERIELRGWQGYRGDLDVKTDSTGTHSWFSSVDGVDIMFHVSTELPSGEDEQQQLGKKRRIGNDLGVIIFQDGGSFVPPIVSQLLHVYTVVSPVEIDGREFYRVEMSQKAGVEMCSPPLDAPYSLYPATPAFKRLLTYKIVNAQLAAMRSPFLSRKIFEPSKRALLEELVKRFGPPDRPGLIKRMGSIYQFFDEPASPRLASPRRNSLRDSLKRAMSRSKRSNTTDSADESSGGAAVAAAAVAAVAAQTTSSAAASSTGAGDDEQRTLVRGGPSKQASKLGQSTRAADHDDEKQL
jgi:hypothetical protein